MSKSGVAFLAGFLLGRVGWRWMVHLIYLLIIVILVYRRHAPLVQVTRVENHAAPVACTANIDTEKVDWVLSYTDR